MFSYLYKQLPRRRQWHPTPVLLPGKSHGRRSLVGCSPWDHAESDKTERLHFHFSLSCFGEGNGNPLQCSCLENPRDGRAWWTAVYGVAQSRTRLKWFSSSSSSSINSFPLYYHHVRTPWLWTRYKTQPLRKQAWTPCNHKITKHLLLPENANDNCFFPNDSARPIDLTF